MADYERDHELTKEKLSEIMFFEEGGVYVTYADEKAKEAFVKHLRAQLNDEARALNLIICKVCLRH